MADITIKLELLDNQGGTTSKAFTYDGGTLTQADTFTASIKTAMVGVSGCGIFRATSTEAIKNVTTATTPSLPTSNVDEGMTLSVMLSNGERGTLKVPSPARDAGSGEFTFIVGGVVDITNPLVINYAKLFGKAGFAGLASDGPLSIAGAKVTALLSGTLDER